jgi:hypothetical protein
MFLLLYPEEVASDTFCLEAWAGSRANLDFLEKR